MTHASIFSGIGGSDIAASMLGWKNLFHCEINPFGRKVLRYWFPKAESYEDITQTDFSKWRGKVNVLSGGFPCQPFSVVGKRKGAQDERYLWPYMLRCIDQIRPDWVIAENVTGIVSMVEPGQTIEMESQTDLFNKNNNIRRFKHSATFTIQRICCNLESHGYSVQPFIIPACAVGAPHRRDRIFIVACRIVADSDSMGREQRRGTKNKRKADKQSILGKSKGFSCSRFAPNDTKQKVKNLQQKRKNQTHRTRSIADIGNGGKDTKDGYASNSSWYRLERLLQRKGHGDAQRQRQITRDIADHIRSVSPDNGRWRTFPSVSPSMRGNDGVPFDVDYLTISFTQWRRESIKAYGNAIVPQVIYELYRAIDIIENKNYE